MKKKLFFFTIPRRLMYNQRDPMEVAVCAFIKDNRVLMVEFAGMDTLAWVRIAHTMEAYNQAKEEGQKLWNEEHGIVEALVIQPEINKPVKILGDLINTVFNRATLP